MTPHLSDPGHVLDPPIEVTVSDPRILIHCNLAAGETPENVAGLPNGDFLVTLALARQVVRITPQGHHQVLATLPAPADGGADVPITHRALTTGVLRVADGTIYIGYASGDDTLTGIWRIVPQQPPERVIALPGDAFPNGMSIDERSGALFIADSVRGAIWQASLGDGKAKIWTSGDELKPIELSGPGFGVNGLKAHNGAIYVSITGQKTLLRYPIGKRDEASSPHTVMSGHPLDDFIFLGKSDVMLAASNVDSELAVIRADGSYQALLTNTDGLQNASAVLAQSGKVYVLSAAYVTQEDPNILVADLDSNHTERAGPLSGRDLTPK
jgi:hypothetical protein